MDYDPTVCVTDLTAAGTLPICDQLPDAPYHCDDLVSFNPAMHNWCAQHGEMYTPVQGVACIEYDANNAIVGYKYFPPNQVLVACGQQSPLQQGGSGAGWALGYCYCCCSCLAYDTLIAVPGGRPKKVQEFSRGDKVLAGSLALDQWSDAPMLTWDAATVSFSDGAANDVDHQTVYLAFGDELKTGDLICSMDQPVVLSNGKLTTAEKLQPGDNLLDMDGKPIKVRTVAYGTFRKGVHHIGTSVRHSDVNGHLIVAGGVVVGDYYLQLHYPSIAASQKDESLAARAAISDPAYEQTCQAQASRASLLFGEVPEEGAGRLNRPDGGVFTVYSARPAYLESVSASFLTEAQAVDVMINGKQLPLANPIPRSDVNNLMQIFSGFYPGLVFYLDWYRMEPNVYAVEQYGQKIVVVTGGLARMSGFTYEGIAMAMAHAVNRFSGLAPVGVNGFTGTGAADYFAFSGTSRNLWWGNRWLSYVLPAMSQMQALLGLISPENAGGNADDPVNEPSIACRIQTMQTAIGGGGVPPCCGGPAIPMIGIQAVTASTSGVELTLTIAPTADTAEVAANYVISPPVPVTAVSQNPQTDFMIRLSADLVAGTGYTVTIQNLDSMLGSGVDPAHASMKFTVS